MQLLALSVVLVVILPAAVWAQIPILPVKRSVDDEHPIAGPVNAEPGLIGSPITGSGTAAGLNPNDAGFPVIENECSHERSRKVRAILADHVLNVLTEHKYEVPLSCPLHPSLDRYRAAHSDHRERARGSQWKCKLCSKVFRTAAYMDQHFDRMHAKDILPASPGTCLADYCTIFGCDDHSHGASTTHHLGRPLPPTHLMTHSPSAGLAISHAMAARDDAANAAANAKGGRSAGAARAAAGGAAVVPSRTVEVSEHHPNRVCVPREMEKLKHVCTQLMNRCFPPDKSATALQLHDRFMADICDRLKCNAAGKRVASFVQTAQPTASEDTKVRLYYMGIGFVFVILTIFYVALAVYRNELSFHSDLRRLQSSRHSSRLAFWRKEKDKPF